MTGICTTMTTLPCALFWGAISVSGIIVGVLMRIFAPLTYRAIASTVAVAAGLMLAGPNLELVLGAITVGSSLAACFVGIMIGTIGFSWANSNGWH